MPATEVGPAAEDILEGGFIGEDAPWPPHPQGDRAEGTDAEPANKRQRMEPNNKEESSITDRETCVDDVRMAPSGGLSEGTAARIARRTACGGSIHNTGRGKESQARIRSCLRRGVDRFVCAVMCASRTTNSLYLSLIIACKYRPLPILKQALVLLAPSSPFVVYHEFLEPLVECYLYLQQLGAALRMVLSDTWLREFQTLPGRVRPDMFMSTSGGFILSGIFVGMAGVGSRTAVVHSTATKLL